MTPLLYAAMAAAAVVAAAGGWLASTRIHQRQITLLQLQLKSVRQTAAEHAAQARRQVGQLQAELAARPPRVEPLPAAPEPEADAPRRKAFVADRFDYHEDGFPQTAIVADGYAPTQLMR